ncbi:hypothetical protein F383_11001 [Gossypium arboreum]|uniref:Uncharacterized protein n=1 Tax=Gossypium arboreum TaxID=29729 RepID=A0A0B0NEX6_GOSAR|nr:hypothetical protein F383_11001 [Gossypium arboreum]
MRKQSQEGIKEEQVSFEFLLLNACNILVVELRY